MRILCLRRRRRKSLPRRSDAAPPQYLCPVLGEVMTDPVTTCDGEVLDAVERSAARERGGERGWEEAETLRSHPYAAATTRPRHCRAGHTYEREAIEMWFRTYAERYPLAASAPSPVTGAMLASTALVSNIALRQVIETWREGREGLGG